MYAIVKAGGKQYKVSPGDIVKVDKIEGEAGKNLVFEDILMVVDDNDRIEIGRPILTDVKVSGEITKQTKGEKIIVFKSKKRKGYRKKTGHRQLLTEVKIKEIHL
jgi:large subunit ribosomal protein L21